MTTVELFANQPLTTVASGGTDAPSSGTQETWTVASSSSFPAASSTASPPAQFHVADVAEADSSELIAVTNVSGTTWTVTRGAESTTPVAHAAGFAITQVVTAGALGGLMPSPSGTASAGQVPVATGEGETSGWETVSTIATGLDTAKPAAAAGNEGQYYFGTDTEILYYSDGSLWQFAVNQKEGTEGPQIFDRPGETLLIPPSASYTVLTASGGLTITQDTTDYEWGTQSIKMVTSGNGASNYATISFSPALDLSEQCLSLGMEIDSFTPYSDFQIRLSSDGFGSSNFDYCQPIYTSLAQRWVEAGIWEDITINRGGPAGNMSDGQWKSNGTGLASYKSVTALRFKLVDNGGSAPMTIRLGFLSYFERPPKAIVTLAFDDSRLTQYTVAKPAMDAYRMRGVSYNIGYDVINEADYPGAYFSEAQMIDLQASSNWEIAAHAFTDTTGVMAHTYGYDSLTTHDGQIDVLQLRTWLRSMQAQGIDDFALPHGQWDLNLEDNPNPNPNVLGMMSQYFNTCRTTYGNTIETYPPANRAKLRCYVAQSTDTATTIMEIVSAAVLNKWWLILVFHNLPATVSGSSDFAAAQFQSLIPQIAAADCYIKTVQEVMRSGVRPGQGTPTPLQFSSPAYVADAAYTVTSNNDLVAYTSLTAARAVTLPAVTALSGKIVTIKDESGDCNGTNTITISRRPGRSTAHRHWS